MDAAVSHFRFFERMRDCHGRLANRARLGNALARALAFLLISQILNELSYFHRRTADHDPKRKVDFQRIKYPHRALPFRLFLSGVVESIIEKSKRSAARSRPRDIGA